MENAYEMLNLVRISLMPSKSVSKGMGYKSTDYRPWVVAIDGWMYGRQSLTAIISDKRARRASTARFSP